MNNQDPTRLPRCTKIYSNLPILFKITKKNQDQWNMTLNYFFLSHSYFPHNNPNGLPGHGASVSAYRTLNPESGLVVNSQTEGRVGWVGVGGCTPLSVAVHVLNALEMWRHRQFTFVIKALWKLYLLYEMCIM